MFECLKSGKIRFYGRKGVYEDFPICGEIAKIRTVHELLSFFDNHTKFYKSHNLNLTSLWLSNGYVSKMFETRYISVIFTADVIDNDGICIVFCNDLDDVHWILESQMDDFTEVGVITSTEDMYMCTDPRKEEYVYLGC